MTFRSKHAYVNHRKYVSTLREYDQLLTHPLTKDDEYRKKQTTASVLFPALGIFSSIFNFDEVYSELQEFQSNSLEHCHFQYWYLNDDSETHIYTNSSQHGSTLWEVTIQQSIESLQKQIFDECDNSVKPEELSVGKCGLWPIVLVACRHYRLPVPINYLESMCQGTVPT